jgi:hypothetical protein
LSVSNRPPVSPFPRASVARVLDPANDKLGATLVARQLGYLTVKITFHKQPLHDLEVRFYEAQPDGTKGAQVGGKTFKTDRTGRASLDYLVDTGVYVVEIENQTTPALVSTVTDIQKPYVVPLPVNRPYFDFDEACEFDDALVAIVDYVSADGGGDSEGDGDADDGGSAAAVTDALGLDQWDPSS